MGTARNAAVRLTAEQNEKLKLLAMGEGLSVTKIIALLVDLAPVREVKRSETALKLDMSAINGGSHVQSAA